MQIIFSSIKLYLSAILILVSTTLATAQKVGLVLSGGGASAMSHIGVIKALEEHHIPIDYIAGSSMGALVGGLYASGVSPEEMEAMFTSEEFRNMSKGKLDDKYVYYFKQKEISASWITIKLALDTILQSSLPTSFISPVVLDFEMMTMFSGAAAKAEYDFDKLFVPFRCVASDIEAKKTVVFRNGNLSKEIRASMSYPFFLKPITIDGKLLFDGGLYNNFPTDVAYDDFFPDIIIGSNVSSNFEPPTEDDVISQIKNMLVSKTDYSIKCENGICIEPEVDVGVFDYSRPLPIIKAGYEETIARMDEIKAAIERRVDKAEIDKRRKEFRADQPKLVFDQINIEGLKRRQAKYVRAVLRKRNKDQVSVEDIKPGYFRVFGDDKIRSIFPVAQYKPHSGFYDLNLKVKKEKDLIVDFGGNFSNRPINEAFIGLQYNYLSNIGLSLMGNLYFGKLYGSTQAKIRVDFPVGLPFYLEADFTQNRWDYFESKSEFFQPASTSFLIQNEKFAGVSIGFPMANKGRIKTGAFFGVLNDKYFLKQNFTQADTAYKTTFDVFSTFLHYERSTLNRKQYANAGTYLSIKSRYVQGVEMNIPGSVLVSDTLHYGREWAHFKFQYDNYYKRKGALRLGIYFEGVYSSQSEDLRNNYTASILKAPAFQPTPESKTLFLESFRAYQYAAIGHKFIFNIKNMIDLRLEAYLFQPYQVLLKEEDLSVSLGEPFDKRYTIATVAAVYHSPVGPVSISLNYYHNNNEVAPEDKTPLTFLFHFGYVLFNNRAIE